MLVSPTGSELFMFLFLRDDIRFIIIKDDLLFEIFIDMYNMIFLLKQFFLPGISFLSAAAETLTE